MDTTTPNLCKLLVGYNGKKTFLGICKIGDLSSVTSATLATFNRVRLTVADPNRVNQLRTEEIPKARHYR